MQDFNYNEDNDVDEEETDDVIEDYSYLDNDPDGWNVHFNDESDDPSLYPDEEEEEGEGEEQEDEQEEEEDINEDYDDHDVDDETDFDDPEND